MGLSCGGDIITDTTENKQEIIEMETEIMGIYRVGLLHPNIQLKLYKNLLAIAQGRVISENSPNDNEFEYKVWRFKDDDFLYFALYRHYNFEAYLKSKGYDKPVDSYEIKEVPIDNWVEFLKNGLFVKGQEVDGKKLEINDRYFIKIWELKF